MRITCLYSLIRGDEVLEAGAFELIDKEEKEIACYLRKKYSLGFPYGVHMEKLSENSLIKRLYFANSYQLVFVCVAKG